MAHPPLKREERMREYWGRTERILEEEGKKEKERYDIDESFEKEKSSERKE